MSISVLKENVYKESVYIDSIPRSSSILERESIDVDWEDLERFLEDSIPKSKKNLSIKSAINEIMTRFLENIRSEAKELESENKKLEREIPLYSSESVVYYALPAVVALRDQLVEELGKSQDRITKEKIINCSRVGSVKNLFNYDSINSQDTLMFFNNLLTIDLIYRYNKFKYISSSSDEIPYQLIRAGDFRRALEIILDGNLKKLDPCSIYENYKNKERLDQEMVLQKDLIDLLDKWGDLDSNKEQGLKERGLFEEDLTNLIKKYQIKKTIVGHQVVQDSNFLPEILDLQSKVIALIEKNFSIEEGDKVSSENIEHLENLKDQINSIKLETSFYIELILLPTERDQDERLIKFSEEFIYYRAFHQALECISRIENPEKKNKHLLQSMISVLKNNSEEELKQVIDTMLVSKAITSKDREDIYIRLEEARSLLKKEKSLNLSKKKSCCAIL